MFENDDAPRLSDSQIKDLKQRFHEHHQMLKSKDTKWMVVEIYGGRNSGEPGIIVYIGSKKTAYEKEKLLNNIAKDSKENNYKEYAVAPYDEYYFKLYNVDRKQNIIPDKNFRRLKSDYLRNHEVDNYNIKPSDMDSFFSFQR